MKEPHRIKSFAAFVVVNLLASGACSRADLFDVVANGSDIQLASDGTTGGIGQSEIRVGYGSTLETVYVGAFALPALPEGDTVHTANLRIAIIGGNDWTTLYQKGIDLYGVRLSSSPTVLASDFYAGPYGDDPNGTPIMEHLVYQPNSVNAGFDSTLLGHHETDDDADANLAGWLQTLYEDPSYDPAGTNYAILRINSQGNISTAYRYFSVGSADNATESNRPLLTIESIPEPDVAALLFAGAAAMALRHRRSCRPPR